MSKHEQRMARWTRQIAWTTADNWACSAREVRKARERARALMLEGQPELAAFWFLETKRRQRWAKVMAKELQGVFHE